MSIIYTHPTGNLTNSNLEFERDSVIIGGTTEILPCPHCIKIDNTHYKYKSNLSSYNQYIVPLSIKVIADDTFCSADVCVECIKEALKIIEKLNG